MRLARSAAHRPTARDPWVWLEQTPGVVMNQQNVGGNKSGQQSTFTVHGTLDLGCRGSGACQYEHRQRNRS
jgi:hypothetical protein